MVRVRQAHAVALLGVVSTAVVLYQTLIVARFKEPASREGADIQNVRECTNKLR